MSQKKILIVDDELGARESLKVILKGREYDLLIAARTSSHNPFRHNNA